MLRFAIRGEVFFETLDGGTKNKLRVFDDLSHLRPELILDRLVLRFQVEERNVQFCLDHALVLTAASDGRTSTAPVTARRTGSATNAPSRLMDCCAASSTSTTTRPSRPVQRGVSFFSMAFANAAPTFASASVLSSAGISTSPVR